MKYLCRSMLCVSTLLWLGCATTPVTCDLIRPPATDLPQRGISAHRGGKWGCPVNTISAFQRAICHGVHQIELDVRLTADNIVVISHDDQVVGEDGQWLSISNSTLEEVKRLKLEACDDEDEPQHIPTLEEALAIMPQNIWINVDMKDSRPEDATRIAESVARAQRFPQVIFGNRGSGASAVRQVAKKAGVRAWVANLNRTLFRSWYIDHTLSACDDYIQLTSWRGQPSATTMSRLKQAGVRVNYSWLRDDTACDLQEPLESLFRRKVDFVLVDSAEEAMKVSNALGIRSVVPRWRGSSPFVCSDP